MSEKYKADNRSGVYFVTLTVVDWIDFFTRAEHKSALVEDLAYCQQHKGLVLHAWVLMPSHIHMIISCKPPFKLADILRDFKKHSSKRLVAMMQDIPESRRAWLLDRFGFIASQTKRVANYKFWQDGDHPVELWSSEFVRQKTDYIHQNPVKALIVLQPEEYLFSSALNYIGKKGLLEVEVL